jgi:hypothetical protein
MSARSFLVLTLCALTFVACDKKKDESTAPMAASATPIAMASAAAPPSAPAVPLTDKDLPVKADFAGTVRKQITKTNYKAELDKTEQDIAKK